MEMYNRLIWEDDFDGPELDMTKWSFRTGNWQVAPDGTPVVPGWGNRELQYYTEGGGNVSLGGSRLSLIARMEDSPEQFGRTCSYTSARIDTRGKFSFTYGRIEFRASCPLGTGLWPAVWMLPEGEEYGPWAASGRETVPFWAIICKVLRKPGWRKAAATLRSHSPICKGRDSSLKRRK